MLFCDTQVGKRSGQIPPFGNWDYANDLPITQYFESARQAGLIRFSSASGEFDHSLTSAPHHNRPPPTHYQVPFSSFFLLFI